MSILVIQGPHRDAGLRMPSPKALIESIRDRASVLGANLLSRSCASVADISDCLSDARQEDTEMVRLDSGDLDPGDLDRNADALCAAINRLRSPFIEVRDDSAQSLDPRLRLTQSPLVTVIINHDLAENYAIAMAIAARRPRPLTSDGLKILQA